MSNAYKERVKEVNETFRTNAQSVQEMIARMESDIFQLLRKKEKLREKVVALREEKRLQPSMRDRTAILLDDVADFANLYNLRQPVETKIPGVSVSSSSDRPVLGEGPKLTRHLVLEMNPLDVIEQTPPGTPGSPKNMNNNNNALSPKDDSSSQVSGSAFSLGSAGGHNVQLVDQPSVACSVGLAFRSLNFPYVPPGTRVVLNYDGANTGAAAAASPPSSPLNTNNNKNNEKLKPIQVDPNEAPIVGLRFNLVIPANVGLDLEGIRDKVQAKLDAQLDELRNSIDAAQTKLTDAVDRAGKEFEEVKKEILHTVGDGVDEEKKSIEGGKNNSTPKKGEEEPGLDMNQVGDLLWKSLRLVVGVTKGASAHPSRFSVAVVTIYVYRILSAEQKAKQDKIAAQMEQKVNSALKEAGADNELKQAQDFATSRTGRQLSAVCRLVADCNFSMNCEVQITAASTGAVVPVPASLNISNALASPASLRQNAEKALNAVGKVVQDQIDNSEEGTLKPGQVVQSIVETGNDLLIVVNSNNNNNIATSSNLLSMERKAEDLASRVLESAPRIERAMREAFKYVTDAVTSKTESSGDEKKEAEETKKKGIEYAQNLYKQHILPAVQRNIDPEDRVIALINQLVGGSTSYFIPLRTSNGAITLTPKSGSPTTRTSGNNHNNNSSSSKNENTTSAASAPFALSLNAHHTELFSLPKQLVRQTANMIYDYFLDTTASLSGRAYIGMCRRRTLAGVALYDALHFNVAPLQQGSKSDIAKSACAFYHSEKIMRNAIIRMVEAAVEQAIVARSKMTKAIDDEKADEGKKLQEHVEKAKAAASRLGLGSLSGVTKDSVLSSTLSTLKLAMRIGKNLFSKFKEERDRADIERAAKQKEAEDSESAAAVGEEDARPSHAFAFVDGQVCCCDPGRPLEIDVFMPDSRAVATFKMVLRPARAEAMSPRIRARRKDARGAQAQAAAMTSQNCTGYCTAALPEFGLQIGEAFANVWLTEIEEYVAKEICNETVTKNGDDDK